MIRLLHGDSADEVSLNAMFKGRAKVFVDRLGWPLPVGKDGREVDQFDAFDPLYILAYDGRGELAGSMRLLPTSGPTLLTNVFADTFIEPVDVRSATVWEVTRFCVHPGARETTPTGMSRAVAELCIALAEVGLEAGLSQFIGIYDTSMARVYDRIGWRPERLASSKPGYPERLHVGLWEIDDGVLATMRGRSGLGGPVMERDVGRSEYRAA